MTKKFEISVKKCPTKVSKPFLAPSLDLDYFVPPLSRDREGAKIDPNFEISLKKHPAKHTTLDFLLFWWELYSLSTPMPVKSGRFTWIGGRLTKINA